MFLAEQLTAFYPDLLDERFVSNFVIYHQRYSTNTFPTWHLAHPFRYVAHNGETNTVRGNMNWRHARQSVLESEPFGKDLQNLFPITEPNCSDSAAFDNALEL